MAGFGGSRPGRNSVLAQMSSPKKSFGLRKRLLVQTLCAGVIFALLWGLFHIQSRHPWLTAARQAVRENLAADYDVRTVARLINEVGLWGDTLEREALSRLSVPASGQMEPADAGMENPGAVLIFSEQGAAVRAVDAGRIQAVGEDPDLGLWLELRTEDGKTAKYGYCQDILVQEGDWVGKGQVVARVGQTGGAAFPQLYFSLTQDDQVLDVMELFR